MSGAYALAGGAGRPQKSDEPPEGGSSSKPAATYSPRPLRAKYHRRREA